MPSEVKTVPAVPLARGADTPELLPTSIEPRVRSRVTVPENNALPPADISRDNAVISVPPSSPFSKMSLS